MKGSQLFALVCKLQVKEVLTFRNWIRGNGQTEQGVLLEQLIKIQKGNFPDDRKMVFEQVFPKRDYQDSILRQLMFQLQKEIQHFLAVENFCEDELQLKTQLLPIYRQRELDKHFKQTTKKLYKDIEQQPYRNADYYDRKYQLFTEENTFIESRERTVPMNLQEIGDTLEVSFIIKKLRQSCLAVSHQSVFKIEYQVGMLTEVLAFVERSSLQQIPAIALYYHCYLALTAPQKTRHHFSEFKKLIVQYKSAFPSTEIRELYLIAINHCIKGINRGEEAYVREAFGLYQLGLEQDFLLDGKMITRFTYRNVVAAGLKLREFDWVAGFIDAYQGALDKTIRKGTYYYCLSKYHYERNDLSRAMQLLQQANYDDLISNLAAKALLLKIYYEIREFETLDYFLISFQAFIKRQKGIGYHKDNYLNLVSLTRKLLSTNLFDKTQGEKLKVIIYDTQPLTERNWLLEQLSVKSKKLQ